MGHGGGRAGATGTAATAPAPPQENDKSPSQNRKAKDATSDNGKDGLAYSALLKNELLGAGIEKVQDPQTEDRRLQPSTPEKKGLFTVRPRWCCGDRGHSRPQTDTCPAPQYSLSAKRSSPDDGNDVSPYSLSPVSNKSQKLLRSPRKPTRKISKIPFKVLDAPELQDDFYLNLVDWSSLNVLSVGLGTCVYLWSACTSQVGPTVPGEAPGAGRTDESVSTPSLPAGDAAL